MVLEVTANDDKGKEFFKESKTWFEIGVDNDRDMRYGAWQIKELIDLTLPPRQTRAERYLIHFDSDTTAATVNVKLWYYLSGKEKQEVHSYRTELLYPQE